MLPEQTINYKVKFNMNYTNHIQYHNTRLQYPENWHTILPNLFCLSMILESKCFLFLPYSLKAEAEMEEVHVCLYIRSPVVEVIHGALKLLFSGADEGRIYNPEVLHGGQAVQQGRTTRAEFGDLQAGKVGHHLLHALLRVLHHLRVQLVVDSDAQVRGSKCDRSQVSQHMG
jgi:hypothetical protein